MTTILVYTREDEVGQRLKERIQDLLPDDGMESFKTIDMLIQRLRQPVNGFSMAILLVDSRGELEKILEVGDLLYNLRVIMILPDRCQETVTAALRLRPRYLSYADGDFLDVSMVAGRMLQKYHLIRT